MRGTTRDPYRPPQEPPVPVRERQQPSQEPEHISRGLYLFCFLLPLLLALAPFLVSVLFSLAVELLYWI